MRQSIDLYDRYMEYARKFELEYRNASSGAAYDLAEYPKRYVVAPGKKFTPPDWSVLYTNRPPAMTEEDYIQSIIHLAKADFLKQNQNPAQRQYTLLQSFIQCASPDRIAIYHDSMRHTKSRMNATYKFFDEFGHTVLRWNAYFDAWECTLTSLEKARMEIYKEVYRNSFNGEKMGRKHPPNSSMFDIHG